MEVDRSSSGTALVDQVLGEIRIIDTHYCTTRLSAPWGLRMDPCDIVTYHFVAAGRCLLDGRLWLEAGDFVVFPHGRGHVIMDAPDRVAHPVRQLPKETIGANSTLLEFGGGGAPALLLCGGSLFRPGDHPLLATLPEMLTLRADDRTSGLADLLRAEAENVRPGSETIITRISDVLVLHALRAWLERGEGSALYDRNLGAALAAMHADPVRPWTVAALASLAHLSRSSFARRFADSVGVPPIEYLTQLRMHRAATLMSDHGLSPTQVASKVGYDSLAAFSRAYKRVTGDTPGAVHR